MKLTPRQKEILRLLSNGFDAKSAGRELDISVHTVNEHLREARRLLGVSSSREAARILRQAEGTPPNHVGPEAMGVVHPSDERFWSSQSSRKRWLVYTGGSLVILIALAATALSIANGGSQSTHASSASKSTASRPNAEKNPSPYQSREVAIGSFEHLKVSGPFKVGVIVSREVAQVRIQGPAALLADTIATLEGDTLTIRFREGANWSWNPGSGVSIFVSTPNLNSISVEGAANVEVFGVSGDMFSAALDGSGTISARRLAVRHAQLTTDGAGDITVEGIAREGTYVIGGSGSIDAKRMPVKTATIAIGGAGSAYADVSNSAIISMSGSGHVEVVGGATCIKQPSNSPRVVCR